MTSHFLQYPPACQRPHNVNLYILKPTHLHQYRYFLHPSNLFQPPASFHTLKSRPNHTKHETAITFFRSRTTHIMFASDAVVVQLPSTTPFLLTFVEVSILIEVPSQIFSAVPPLAAAAAPAWSITPSAPSQPHPPILPAHARTPQAPLPASHPRPCQVPLLHVQGAEVVDI
jgi:hypothetical protein